MNIRFKTTVRVQVQISYRRGGHWFYHMNNFLFTNIQLRTSSAGREQGLAN